MNQVFLPMAQRDWMTQRGLEIWPGAGYELKDTLAAAHPQFIRTYLLWSKVEKEKGTLKWDDDFDRDLDVICKAGAAPMVVLKMAPRWARADERPCGRIAESEIARYGEFCSKAAVRYPQVVYWEIWNEPDSPTGAEEYYGCWANIQEPGWGGGYYSKVMQTVYPAIKVINHRATVLSGGLIDATGPYCESMVANGLACDGISFHRYAWYKAADPLAEIIKDILAIRSVNVTYGAARNLWLTETALLCDWLPRPDAAFQEAQEAFLAKVAKLAEEYNLAGWSWYCLPYNEWYNCSLMDHQGQPTPALRKFGEL